MEKLLCTLERALLHTSSVKNGGQICPLSPNLHSFSSLPPFRPFCLPHSFSLPNKTVFSFHHKEKELSGRAKEGEKKSRLRSSTDPGWNPHVSFCLYKKWGYCLLLRTYHLCSELNDSKKAMVPDKYLFTAVMMAEVVAWRQT